jgi:hypothetical protein
MTAPEHFVDVEDVLTFPDRVSPGVVKLTNHDRVKNWDIQKAKGSTGASTTLNGDDPGKFTATFYLASDEPLGGDFDDFDLWDDFQRYLESLVNGPKPIAVPVYHPDLARNHYTTITVARIGGMVKDSMGGASVAVDFQEYLPAKPKPTAKAAAKPGGTGRGGRPKPDPNADAKAELAALLEQARTP